MTSMKRMCVPARDSPSHGHARSINRCPPDLRTGMIRKSKKIEEKRTERMTRRIEKKTERITGKKVDRRTRMERRRRKKDREEDMDPER